MIASRLPPMRRRRARNRRRVEILRQLRKFNRMMTRAVFARLISTEKIPYPYEEKS